PPPSSPSLHDALPIYDPPSQPRPAAGPRAGRRPRRRRRHRAHRDHGFLSRPGAPPPRAGHRCLSALAPHHRVRPGNRDRPLIRLPVSLAAFAGPALDPVPSPAPSPAAWSRRSVPALSPDAQSPPSVPAQGPAHRRRHYGAKKLDGAQHLVVGDGPHRDLQQKPVVAEDLVLVQDL